ncbi:MAG TPA: 50S ribosomal protein L20 [Anaerolineales bacterium]|nr:50S ribosomal protein L20 [Anaerolineales bacterium]HRF47476.1 50S ribosomal protein L20 [Anaerolineales bacterium]
MRTKGGVRTRQRHKKVLKLTSGQRGAYHRLYRRANEGLLHAQHYAWRDRRNRRRDLKRLWIVRINAAARINGVSYSKLVAGMKKAGIALDRKVLADIAVRDAAAFAQIASAAKGAL